MAVTIVVGHPLDTVDPGLTGEEILGLGARTQEGVLGFRGLLELGDDPVAPGVRKVGSGKLEGEFASVDPALASYDFDEDTPRDVKDSRSPSLGQRRGLHRSRFLEGYGGSWSS